MSVGDLVKKKSHHEWLVCFCTSIPISINFLAAIVITTECSIKVWLHLSMKFCSTLVPCKILHKGSQGKLILGTDKVGNNIEVNNTWVFMVWGGNNRWSSSNIKDQRILSIQRKGFLSDTLS